MTVTPSDTRFLLVVFIPNETKKCLFYRGGSANWEKYQRGINQYFMYEPDDPAIDGLMSDMEQETVIDVGMYFRVIS